ncbi:hypothetical protein [Streptomyces sp. NPDC058657]|uniref:hypothetical protein n=1 Tax=unclassified Streptomyces TaxID=2593676 RepID=UPI0036610114
MTRPRLPHLVTAWALAHTTLAAVGLATATPLFVLGPHTAPVALNWYVIAVAALALAATAVRARRTGHPAARRALWTAAALSLVSGFSLLMDVVMLLTGSSPDSVAAAAHHALGALGAALLAALARTHGTDRADPVGRAGRGDAEVPPPASAPRPVQLTALAGALAFLPYAAMKTVWATGGTFAGVSGAEALAVSRRNGASGLWLTLESYGIDATALLAALGIFLLYGLVRPWGQIFPRWTLLLAGRRVPRWLPLAPAVLGAATLAPYGVLGVGTLALASFGAVELPPGDFSTPGAAMTVGWVGVTAFAVYGLALAVAARSYGNRTRTE